jgi:hypothetical protein
VQIVVRSLQAARGDSPAELGGTLHSDVIVLITEPEPCTPESPCPTIYNDVGSVEMSLILKDHGSPGLGVEPSPLNQVTITRYRVQYRRTDGHNIEGVDVPYSFDSGVTFTIPANGQVTAGFEIVRHTAKREAPLRALRSSGNMIAAIATVTFYGQDQVGNEISTSANIGVDFGDFGDPK